MSAATDAGVGEEHIDRSVVALGLRHQVLDVGLLADVARHGDALDVARDGLQAGSVAVGHDHALGAFLGIAPRNRLADAARRARDDADLVFYFHSSLSQKIVIPSEATKARSRGTCSSSNRMTRSLRCASLRSASVGMTAIATTPSSPRSTACTAPWSAGVVSTDGNDRPVRHRRSSRLFPAPGPSRSGPQASPAAR